MEVSFVCSGGCKHDTVIDQELYGPVLTTLGIDVEDEEGFAFFVIKVDRDEASDG